MSRRLIPCLLIALVAGVAVAWWSMIRMPGKNFLGAPTSLTPEQIVLRTELISDVQALAGNIGERNFQRYTELVAAADFIEQSFSAAGLRSRRDMYEMRGQRFDNIETEIRGTQSKIVLIGAHYDSSSARRVRTITAMASLRFWHSRNASLGNQVSARCDSLPS